MSNLKFKEQNYTRVDLVFTGYYCLRFFTEEKFEWIHQISPDAEKEENQRRLDFFLSLVLDEENPSVTFPSVWRRFVEKQTAFFYKLHPTCYKAGSPLNGWETRKLVKGFFILCPKMLSFAKFRSYDSIEVIYGRLIDKIVDENGTTFVVVPDNQPFLFSDFINNPKEHTICPFVKGELVAPDTCNRAWYMAEVAPPVVEEFLN